MLLIILSLFPGSLIGFFLYGDFGLQPDLVPGNPFGTTINHFFAYFYVSFLGFCAYLNARKDNFRKLLLILLFFTPMPQPTGDRSTVPPNALAIICIP